MAKGHCKKAVVILKEGHHMEDDQMRLIHEQYDYYEMMYVPKDWDVVDGKDIEEFAKKLHEKLLMVGSENLIFATPGALLFEKDWNGIAKNGTILTT